MVYPAGTYKTTNVLTGYTAPVFSATKSSGRTYAAGVSLSVTAVQENVPGVMVFGRLTNGDWVTIVKNGKAQMTLIGVVTPPPVDPPTGKRLTNIIDVFSDGSINVNPQ